VDEYKTLFKAIGGESRGAQMLKSLTGWDSTGDGIDAFGFSALPAGGRSGNDGGYYSEGSWANFWSSTEYNGNYAYYMYLYYYYDYAFLKDDNKNFGFSVRCLKD
jgi:uncharacterized protein (TIGR02145 family)